MTDPVWVLPTPANGPAPIGLGLRITNLSQATVTFSPYLKDVVLETADGKAVTYRSQRIRALLAELTPVTMGPGKSGTVALTAQLQNRRQRLDGDPPGTGLVESVALGVHKHYLSRYFEGLAPGKYRLSLVYEADGKDGTWKGKVQTSFVEVEVKSAPVVTAKAVTENNADFQLVSAPVWALPLPGGHGSPIGLGLRITNRARESVKFRALQTVILETAHGQLLTPRLQPLPPSLGVSYPVAVAPGSSCLVASVSLTQEPSGLTSLKFYSLRHIGSFEGLAPGKYRVSLGYESDGSEGSWKGKVLTPSIEVEIQPVAAGPR